MVNREFTGERHDSQRSDPSTGRLLGAAALTQLTDHVSLRGPQLKESYFAGHSLIHVVDPTVREFLDGSRGIELMNKIALSASQVAKKAGLDKSRVDIADLIRTYGQRLDAAVKGADYFDSGVAYEAYRRLVIIASCFRRYSR